ncbi:MAG: DUF4160 domain-containing protein [Treponema sp.]|nr:DUF4160 domain-containing protein [Treponema sp.]
MRVSAEEAPHFHVEYGEYEASIAINGPGMTEGDLPSLFILFIVHSIYGN